ncbi:hypothetical protein LCGC14_2095060 [marine sediment metagenome]|uniref:Uncharacterized protein n=1 Tax=marine sediment metagenome TaxID=412755 RepID=A0A0F9EYY7_9ZZZZ
MAEIVTMPVAEFRRMGYLQELNRNFLHPHGLALSIEVDENGNESFGIIWDYRNDPEGLAFADELIDDEFSERAYRLTMLFHIRASKRLGKLGYIIQPTKRSGDE